SPLAAEEVSCSTAHTHAPTATKCTLDWRHTQRHYSARLDRCFPGLGEARNRPREGEGSGGAVEVLLLDLNDLPRKEQTTERKQAICGTAACYRKREREREKRGRAGKAKKSPNRTVPWPRIN
uniref:Uncharacterized protein n=1 Tax=Anopheles atroparvus TaxID=41427 RepID=A0AAG5CYQ3_ANOAO